MTEIDLKTKPVVQLLWSAPTSREDDTPLDPATEIGGYNIYYGASTGNYDTANPISIAGNTLYADLDFNTLPLPFYAVLTTVDNEGRESGYSAEVVFTRKMYPPNPPTGFSVL